MIKGPNNALEECRDEDKPQKSDSDIEASLKTTNSDRGNIANEPGDEQRNSNPEMRVISEKPDGKKF